MTRPGDRLRHLGARVCSKRMQRRLIEPAVADLQAEVAAAYRAGRWRALRALSAGYVSVTKVFVIAVCGDVLHGATTWDRDEAAAARRGALVAALVTTVASVLLLAPPLTRLNLIDPVRLAAYVVPSTLPLSVPLGLAIATAWVLHGAARTRKVAGVVLLTAAMTTAAMFANMAWLTPNANQAFREAVMAQFEPPIAAPVRGTNELSLSELRQRLSETRAAGREHVTRHLEATYYRKWTMSAAPLAIVGLIVALAFRRVWTRPGLTTVACGVFALHYALWMSSFELAGLGAARPIVIDWAGDVLSAAVAVAITWRPQRA